MEEGDIMENKQEKKEKELYDLLTNIGDLKVFLPGLVSQYRLRITDEEGRTITQPNYTVQ